MALTIFDLDNTLLTNDSDYLWGKYMVEQGIVDAQEYQQQNHQFYQDYEQGRLDIDEYLKFALKPLTQHSIEKLYLWRAEFVEKVIRPIIASGAQALIHQHRSNGDTLMIISATNLFITQPIAQLLDIPLILATQPEISNGRYTGNYIGTPTFQQGKVRVLEQWLQENNMDLIGSTFYSDSHNDLSLLQRVDNPVAVNPDELLRQQADTNHWRIIDLRK